MKNRIIIVVFLMFLLNMFISAQQNEDKTTKQRKCPRKVKNKENVREKLKLSQKILPQYYLKNSKM